MEVNGCFRRAAALLADATPAGVLTTVLSTSAGVDEIVDLVSTVDHVGFMSPSGSLASLSSAARAAGFDDGERSFPSTILAAELCTPTTVFQAWGTDADGSPIKAEAFVPLGVDHETVSTWVRTGVGAHIALSVPALGDLLKVRRIIEEEECSIPPFMNGAPLVNAADKLTVVYVDRCRDGRRTRLEFCHRG